MDANNIIYAMLTFDRTAEDVKNGTEKGAWRAQDLSTIAMAIDHTAAVLRRQGYAVTVSPRFDWSEGDIPRQGDMDRLFADIRTLRTLPTLPAVDPAPPASANRLTFEGANNIERFLYNCMAAAESVAENYMYADEVSAGEV